MPFFVVCRSWRGVPDAAEPVRVRLVAGCPSAEQAQGLAEDEAATHPLAGREPDTGSWWASDADHVHCLEITEDWRAR